jgi:membrane-bound lytic murein transglycosylase MltF
MRSDRIICVIFLLVFGCWACKPEVAEAPKKGMVVEEPAKTEEQPKVEVEVRDPRIPSLAYRLKRTVRGEVNYHWGFEQSATIMYSQIQQESAWDEDAVSPAGAQGLAQFMPSTAEWIAKLYPVDLGGKANPLDVRWAIRSMVLYDKFLFDRCEYACDEDNRWRFTLSAYNGGATWVQRDRNLAVSNGKRSDRWICNVEHYSNRSMSAFKENRGYVKRIVETLVPIYKIAGFI